MIPVLTNEEMKAVDEAAPEPLDVLVDRAGAAVARTALRMLGQAYGKRVVVVAGKGNNGADGRVAAQRLERRGVRVRVVEAGTATTLPPSDLVIDAAFGTGFRGEYDPPDTQGARVLAVDVPTGGVVEADVTVTFAALKPAHLFTDCGVVEVADIGLDAASAARAWLIEDDDVVDNLPRRAPDAHKWQTALFVAAGSPGMMGAPMLVARAAMRSGAGYVRLGVPGADVGDLPHGQEAVAVPLPASGWADAVLPELERCQALVVGPGLGRSDEAAKQVRRLMDESPVPVLVDADGLNVLGEHPSAEGCVLTPHDKEFERLAGRPPGHCEARLDATRELARTTGATVLLKGAVTVVARPDGHAYFAVSGGPNLATAGTGDTLSGIIGAFLARGLAPFEAAGFGAHVLGRAAELGHEEGLVAGDLPELVAEFLSDPHA